MEQIIHFHMRRNIFYLIENISTRRRALCPLKEATRRHYSTTIAQTPTDNLFFAVPLQRSTFICDFIYVALALPM